MCILFFCPVISSNWSPFCYGGLKSSITTCTYSTLLSKITTGFYYMFYFLRRVTCYNSVQCPETNLGEIVLFFQQRWHKFGSEWSWWYYRTKDYMKSFKKPDDASDFAVSSTLLASLNFSMFLRSTECQTTTFFSVNSLRIVDPLDQYSERCLHR